MILFMDIIDNELDESKFLWIYDKYVKHLYYEIFEILKEHHKTEDALQETFLRVAKNIDKIDVTDSLKLKKFLTIIARNVSFTMLSKERERMEVELVEEYDDSILFADTTLDKIAMDELVEIIESLKKEERDVLMLYYVYEYSLKEISELCGDSYEAVKKRVQRAVKKLAAMIKKEDYYE